MMYARWAVQCLLHNHNHHPIKSTATVASCGSHALGYEKSFCSKELLWNSIGSGDVFGAYTNDMHPAPCAHTAGRFRAVSSYVRDQRCDFRDAANFRKREELLQWCKMELCFSDAEVHKLSGKYFTAHALDHGRSVVKIFLDGGVSKERTRSMILRAPRVLGRSVKEKLEPLIALVAEYGIMRSEALSMLTKDPACLAQSSFEWRTGLQSLSDIGLSNEEIKRVVLSSPWDIGLRFYDNLEEKIDSYMSIFGVDRNTVVHKLLTKQPMFFCCTIDTVSRAAKLFKNWGLNDQQVAFLALTFPSVFLCRKELLESKFCFAHHILQKDVCEITRSPRYLAASLENVIMFRTALLDNHGLKFWQETLNCLVASDIPTFCRKHGMTDPMGSFCDWWKKLDIDQKYSAIINSKYM